MSRSRIFLKFEDATYRFLELNARPDGSLVLLIDREPSVLGTNTYGIDPNKVVAHAKFSVHTTGIVHYYPHRKYRASSKNLGEPLSDLTKFHAIGTYSIPTVLRLDNLAPAESAGAGFALSVPTTDRITFYFEVGPLMKPDVIGGGAIQLNYELYSFVIRTGPNLRIEQDKRDHFFVVAFRDQAPGAPVMQPNEAELHFHKKIHHGRPPVFRTNDGSYTFLAHVVMLAPPVLKIEFDRHDLSVEQIPFEYGLATHKVKFWIRDRGGRNKHEDLRRHIVSLSLDSQIQT